jgi:hypothetical protein
MSESVPVPVTDSPAETPTDPAPCSTTEFVGSQWLSCTLDSGHEGDHHNWHAQRSWSADPVPVPVDREPLNLTPGQRAHAAYAQGHKDACRDADCVLRPDSTYPSYGQGYADGMASAICGMGGNYGPNLAPLACALPKDHDGEHSTASLPTFVGDRTVREIELAAQVERVRALLTTAPMLPMAELRRALVVVPAAEPEKP